MPNPLSDEEIALIRRNHKRCSEETVAAIIKYHETGDASLGDTIARGIIERYLKPEGVDALKKSTPETPLTSLGIDSLTMLVIILDIQDALIIEIEDSEMRELQTIGDVNRFLKGKVASASA